MWYKLLIFCVALKLSNCQNNLYVRIKEGVLKGKYIETQNGRLARAFTSIRFAKPPTDELRFMPAQAIKPWKGVYNATKTHPECLQLENSRLLGDEDCLFINVYTPKGHRTNLPVIFYIFGGSFRIGSPDITWYRPDYLLNQDIVLVLANYRLGALGFLTTGDKVVPGNLGLKDQALALRWVKRNIEAFGGNPKSVTIAGNSAGAVCAHLHLFSPHSKGLFHKAIINSGFAFAPVFNDYLNHSINIAKIFSCPTTNSTQMMQCLRKVDPKNLIRKERSAVAPGVDMVLGPVIDNYADDAFMPQHPIDALKTGKVADVPVMTGVVHNEGINMGMQFLISPKIMNGLKNDFNNMASIVLCFSQHKDKHFIASKIREFYFKNEGISNSSLCSLANMYGDRSFVNPLHTTVKQHVKYFTQNIYVYFFTYRGSRSSSELLNGDITNYGVAHADELLYLFNLTHKYPNYKPSSEDLQMVQVMTSIWANFALNGNPNSNLTQLYAEWLPVSRNKLNVFHLKSYKNMSMNADGIFEDRL